MVESDKSMHSPNIKRLIINFIIELIVYGVLITIYTILVLRVMADFLLDLFNNQLVVYAFVGLGLIVAQGVLLDLVTTLLIDRLQFDRFE